MDVVEAKWSENLSGYFEQLELALLATRILAYCLMVDEHGNMAHMSRSGLSRIPCLNYCEACSEERGDNPLTVGIHDVRI
jgi:hypothetical protein